MVSKALVTKDRIREAACGRFGRSRKGRLYVYSAAR